MFNLLSVGIITAAVLGCNEKSQRHDPPHSDDSNPEAAGYWLAFPNTNAPEARSDFSIIDTDGNFFVWGGADRNGDFLDSGGFFDLDDSEWTGMREVSAPSARAAHTAVLYEDLIVVWGGKHLIPDSNRIVSLNNGALYNTSTKSWESTVPEQGAPAARSRHLAFATSDGMLIWGGEDDGKPITGGAVYNFKTFTWKEINTTGQPAAGSFQTAVFHDGKLYVWHTGPQTSEGGIYDLASDSWEAMVSANAPSPRENFTTTLLAGGFLIWGGINQEGKGFFADGAYFDFASKTWEGVELNKAYARADHVAIAGDHQVFFWGGRNATGFLNSGILYDHSTGSVQKVKSNNQGRIHAQGFWSGKTYFIWGGQAATGALLREGHTFTAP